MRLAMVSQPRYLPALNYLHRLILSDVFVVLDTVQYTPRDWENRNRIKTPNGNAWLTVPVKRVSREQRIQDTEIVDDGWNRDHLSAIEHNYRRAPFFARYFPLLQQTYSRNWPYLIDLNLELTSALLAVLGKRIEIVRASSLGGSGLSGQELLVRSCREVGSDAYVSGPLGRNYIVNTYFEDAGLSLVYHDYVHPQYPQQFGKFLPFMAGIDLLFNCGEMSPEIIGEGNPTRSDLEALATASRN